MEFGNHFQKDFNEFKAKVKDEALFVSLTQLIISDTCSDVTDEECPQ
jgi:hypothetical protein